MGDRSYAERLTLAGLLTEPAIRQAIAGLALPDGSRGLDVGCGTGRQAAWLAEAAGARCKVTGLDVDRGNLDAARKLATAPTGKQLDWVEGDLRSLPFADRSFDWIWCADTLWPVAVVADPVMAVRELARVLRPGGLLALAFWSGQMLLPGYPVLAARLDAAFASETPYLAEATAGRHFMAALGWLEDAGLCEPRARTYVADVQAPLSARERKALAFVLDMFWGGLEARLSTQDWADFRNLCGDGTHLGALELDHYYGFITYTVFAATVPVDVDKY